MVMAREQLGIEEVTDQQGRCIQPIIVESQGEMRQVKMGGRILTQAMQVLHIGSGVGGVKEDGGEAGEVKVETAATTTKM